MKLSKTIEVQLSDGLDFKVSKYSELRKMLKDALKTNDISLDTLLYLKFGTNLQALHSVSELIKAKFILVTVDNGVFLFRDSYIDNGFVVFRNETTSHLDFDNLSDIILIQTL
jgi:hypothetical protein